MQEKEMMEPQLSDESLEPIRRKIDRLDQTIAQLLAERLSLCRQVGKIKHELGLSVVNHQREKMVLSHIKQFSGDEELSLAVANVYEIILSCSRQIQTGPRSPGKIQKGKVRLYFPVVLIIGLGLIGGALARQIRKMLPGTRIIAVDRADVLEEALSEGVIDGGAANPDRLIKEASLIILSAGPGQNLLTLGAVAPLLTRRQLVIDVGSAKTSICDLAEKLFFKADFVGGHPIFGSEKSGYQNSRLLAVGGKTFCLTPTARTSDLSLKRLRRFLEALKFKVVQADAFHHDKFLARTSHIIQFLSVALGAELSEGIDDQALRALLSFSGGSLEQVSRLMDSPAALWQEIAAQNKDELLLALKDLLRRLEKLGILIQEGQNDGLAEQFALAARVPAALRQI